MNIKVGNTPLIKIRYKYNGKEWVVEEAHAHSDIALGSLYDLNKQVILNLPDLTPEEIMSGLDLIDDFVKYFNISYSASNRLKRKFNITIPNKIEYGHIQHEIFDYIIVSGKFGSVFYEYCSNYQDDLKEKITLSFLNPPLTKIIFSFKSS